MTPQVIWPAEAIWEAVSPTLPGFTVEVLPEVDSTNTELMRRARAGQSDPVLLVAERQTAGRGRLGRPWHSATDAQPTAGMPQLTFSLGLMLSPADWSGLSLAVGLSLAQSLHPDLRLKWPNDLWLDERKLAGILIETAGVAGAPADAGRYVVIGVGINLQRPPGDSFATPPAWLGERVALDAGAALGRVLPPLVQAVQAFAVRGFAPLREAYAARDLLRGRTVRLSDRREGLCAGVDGAGGLLVHTLDGLQTVTSAEVSVRPA